MTKKRYPQFFPLKEFDNYQPNTLDFKTLNLKIKTLQNSLKNSEEMYKKVIMTSNEAIFIIDKNYNILFSSEKAIQMFGFLQDRDIEGKNFFELVFQPNIKKIKRIFKRAFREGFVGGETGRFIKKRDVFVGVMNIARIHNAENIPFALVLTINKIRFENKLKLYETIFNKLNDAIVLHTIDNNKLGKFFEVNETACEQLGLTRDEIIKKNPFDFYENFNKKNFNNVLQRLKKEKKAIFEVSIKKSNCDVMMYEVNAHMIQYNEKPVVLSIVKDIGEGKYFLNKIEKDFIVVKKIMDGIITAMEKLVEKKDLYTVGHQRRTAELAKFLAKEYGMSDNQAEGIYIAAIIHDIGKIFISSSILNKPEKLTENEYEIIKKHPEEGYNILKSIYFPWPIAKIVYQHHERINGTGYPLGLKGDKILLEAKIIGISDVVEAMTFKRPYRKGLGINKALDEIMKNKSKLYDEDISNLCFEVFRKGKFKFK